MSHSTAQPTFTAPPADPALRCPICGGRVINSWWVANLLLCETGCYWSGPEKTCKRVEQESDDSSTIRKRGSA